MLRGSDQTCRAQPYARDRKWLFEDAIPFWAANGIDRVHGGYVEHLNLDGSDAKAAFKRTRVIGRQIYVFSHAALCGWDGLALARHGYDFLTQKAWLGGDGGWARRLDREGTVVDPTPDLYDLAFILFAFGWYYRASKDEGAYRQSIATLDFIERHMRHGSGLGFLHERPAKGPRQQNPHMHLLEAALVNLEATNDERFRRIADQVVGLFTEYFFDPEARSLTEFFAEDLTRLGGERGQLTEPGHLFEWAWILANYQRLTGANMAQYVTSLIETAERSGVSPHSHETWNVVRRDGVLVDGGTRVWPNTERIQAAVAGFEIAGRDPTQVFLESSELLFCRFLTGTPPGTWREQFSSRGEFTSDKIPTSSLYHLVLAFSEMLRVEAAVARQLR